MPKWALLPLLPSAAVLAAACAMPYTKLGASDTEIRADRERCRHTAIERYASLPLPEPHATLETQQCMEAKGYRLPVP